MKSSQSKLSYPDKLSLKKKKKRNKGGFRFIKKEQEGLPSIDADEYKY